MTTWSTEQLAELDAVSEIRVAGSRKDGSLRNFRIIWHVVIDGNLYARSVNGPDAGWYVGVRRQMTGAITWGNHERDVVYVDDASHDVDVDAAYRAKYGNGSPTQALNRDPARSTTLRIDPRS